MSQPDYADLCEWYSSMGVSDAAFHAGSGVRPEVEEDDSDEEETTE